MRPLSGISWLGRVVVAVVCAAVAGIPQAGAQTVADPAVETRTLAEAQSHFYNARYEAAAALTLALRTPETQDLANDELRSSALLFQLRALLEERSNVQDRKDAKEDALKRCAPCPALITSFLADIHHGQEIARARLAHAPADEEALFYLGKLDLNYVWLQLGLMRKKTGWNEYWEARRSLDAVLKRNPNHVRARVARAWIDYIVDTKMPWGTRWILGGGNRKKALVEVREAAAIDTDFFSHAEAEFALWDLHVREKELPQATEVARRLASRFPDNPEVTAFLEARDAGARHP